MANLFARAVSIADTGKLTLAHATLYTLNTYGACACQALTVIRAFVLSCPGSKYLAGRFRPKACSGRMVRGKIGVGPGEVVSNMSFERTRLVR